MEEEAGTLKAYITSELRSKRAAGVERIPIPRFNGKLVLRCRTVSDRERIGYTVTIEQAKDKVQGLIEAAVAQLLSTCEGVETDQTGADGQPVDIGQTLGVGLSQYLGPDAECGKAHDDTEAVLEIFGSEADLVEAVAELQTLSGDNNARIEREIVGNSEATS
jgi:hypothetical protein